MCAYFYCQLILVLGDFTYACLSSFGYVSKQNKELEVLRKNVPEFKGKVAILKRNNKRNKINYLKSRMLVAAKATATVEDATQKVKAKFDQQSSAISALEDQLQCAK